MHIAMRRAALGVAALAALPIAAATADELLVMPYACAVLDGRPVLTPAPDRGHPVVGRREQRRFTACSPVDPSVCRTWTLHRFTLDCGGVRLPWTAVATAAGAPGQRRARLVDGRVQLSMPARWVLAPDDPCARGADFGDRWRYGRLGTYCADRLALSPPAVVEMPPGFAPMFGIDGIFVPQGQGRDPAAAAPWTATTAEATHARPSAGAQPPPPPEKPQEKTAAKFEPTRSPAEPRLRPEPRPNAEPKVHKQPRLQTAEAPTAGPGPEHTSRMSGGPRVINVPAPPLEPTSSPSSSEPASSPTTAQASSAAAGADRGRAAPPVEVPKPVPAVRPGERHLAFAAPLRGDDDARSATVPVSSPAAGTRAPPVTAEPMATQPPRDPATFVVELASAARQPAVTVATGLAALCALLLLAFAMRRQGRQRDEDPVARRDIGSISLDGGVLDRPHAGSEPVGQPARLPPPANSLQASAAPPLPPPSPPALRAQPAVASAVVASAPPPEPKLFQTDVPKTREEALRVLGMGVRPEAGDMALKKIVDGLRLTWHPDNAVDELDRLEREIRLKQINAAWEIIAGKRDEEHQPQRRPPPLPQRENAA
jgi:hypothetical protein